MDIKNNDNSSYDEILIRILLKKLGYDEKIIKKVCEVIK